MLSKICPILWKGQIITVSCEGRGPPSEGEGGEEAPRRETGSQEGGNAEGLRG